MGYTYKFKPNEKYGVDDINSIISNFTSAGVNTYQDLNGMAKVLANAGVVDVNQSCKVVLVGDRLKILPGAAFYSDGSTIEIGRDGETLDIRKYVYFTKNLITKEGYPISSDTAPGSNDIPLAEYDSKNGLADVRKGATFRIDGLSRPSVIELEFEQYNNECSWDRTTAVDGICETKIGEILFEETDLSSYKYFYVMDNLNPSHEEAPYYAATGSFSEDGMLCMYLCKRETRAESVRWAETNCSSFMIYGVPGHGKVYVRLAKKASGIDVYLQTEANLPDAELNGVINIKMKIMLI